MFNITKKLTITAQYDNMLSSNSKWATCSNLALHDDPLAHTPCRYIYVTWSPGDVLGLEVFSFDHYHSKATHVGLVTQRQQQLPQLTLNTANIYHYNMAWTYTVCLAQRPLQWRQQWLQQWLNKDRNSDAKNNNNNNATEVLSILLQ